VSAVSPGRSQSLALGILIFGALAIASSGIFVRLSQTGPTATAFWRGMLAVPVFAVWILIDARRKGAGNVRQIFAAPDWHLLLAGAFFGLDLLLWHWSLLLTSVAASTLEANLAPLIVTLIAWAVWRQRPQPKFLLALAVALIGLVLIVSPKMGTTGRNASSLLGDLLGVGTACFYAGYLAIISRARGSISTGVVMFWTTLAFSVLLLPIALTQKFLPDDLHGWALLAGLALIVHCLGQGLVAYALAHLPATFGSVGLFVQPIASGVYAWLILGEQLVEIQIVGAAVVLFAIALARSASSNARAEPVEPRAPD
jgi:drug/metabolite transporter (DMT)-like permease